MSFTDFLNQAWADHADRPLEVGERLKSQALAESSADFIALAGLITHVYGEHLGQWSEGISQLQKLKTPDAEAEAAIRRSVASLELSGGDTAMLDTLTASDRVRVLATSASALAEQRETARAATLFNEALSAKLAPEDPAIRSLAITGNNLACALEEKPARTADETNLMIAAAQAARKFWEQAGTWVHVERAEYRLANTYLKAGELEKARHHARECLRICEANSADDFEMKYAREIVSLTSQASD